MGTASARYVNKAVRISKILESKKIQRRDEWVDRNGRRGFRFDDEEETVACPRDVPGLRERKSEVFELWPYSHRCPSQLEEASVCPAEPLCRLQPQGTLCRLPL
jgi:hypothetical protein